MDYEGRICNTPAEKASFKLPVSVGCSYNACMFCGLFKHLRFRELPLSQIEDELLRVKSVGGKPKRVMLGDGNAFDLPFERLQAIFDLIHQHLPSCESICADATVTAILRKTDEQLTRLANDGLTMLYIGVESGLDDVLSFMRKDHNNTECREATEKLHRTGIDFGAHIMTGVAGAGRGIENAEATAHLLNETRPTYICNFSMMVGFERTPLDMAVQHGEFIPASELESLAEERHLISKLSIPVRYDGFHDNIAVRVRGTLPDDHDRILCDLDHRITEETARLGH
ncbi:radical SAM protein [Adlercreutzia sp. ZJ138]|uniref:radical SAM protein n=1 Tax=Adlercreutzia sp. ZJ138 TaxID=2709405 RepID=UPI0013ED7881|nr:radical SAM protein [Adlercreutzia sp. ZJ138]